jgi:AcrR family transcriptional regulator
MLTVSTLKRNYHHGNLRAVLIDSGLLVIAEKGVRALTLREIGTRAGVSRTAAYRHFSSKADLLFAICEAGFVQFGAALEQAKVAAAPSFRERMLAMGMAYVRFAREHPAYYEVMFQNEAEHVRKGATAARGFAILEKTIREGQESGDVMAGNSNEIAELVWSVVHGVGSLGMDRPGFTEFCLDALLRGIRPQS